MIEENRYFLNCDWPCEQRVTQTRKCNNMAPQPGCLAGTNVCILGSIQMLYWCENTNTAM